jgi:anti-sigma regulatory factor (Ser/Thr protein kinase)
MPLARLRAAETLDLAPGDILVLLSDGLIESRDPSGEEYGLARIRAVLAEHHGRSMAELAGALLASARAFARGAPQEDDVTAVLVKREDARPSVSARFARGLGSLEPIFGFVGDAFARLGVAPALRGAVELAVEELFTNMVKYGRSGDAEIGLTLAPIPGGVEATLVDRGAAPFDITRVPDVDVGLPIERREPGGLGIHLVRRMVDSIHYEYREDLGQARITFRKTSAGPPGPGGSPRTGGGHARD